MRRECSVASAMAPRPLTLDPDRLLPSEPSLRERARAIYREITDLPIVSPHGHVPASLLADDRRLDDPAALLITPDHYVTRLIHSQGVPLEDLGVPRRDGREVESDPRAIWRLLCRHWNAFRATPSRFWLEWELHELFGVRTRPSPDTADEIYDRIEQTLASPELRPRALYRRFNLEVLATTDSPLSNLSDHLALRDDPAWDGRVIPTFRPDSLVDVASADWAGSVAALGAMTGTDTTHFSGYLEALRSRRAAFADAGATATDHGPRRADTTRLETAEAATIYGRALAGKLDVGDSAAFGAHMLDEFARMSCDDGLVMQLHPGVHRNHDAGTATAFGPDVGADIPAPTDYTNALQPLLNRYGSHPNFTLVVFTTDETTFSRELAPLAGYYPAVRLGAPWWFLDAPDALRRFREATTDTAGFANTAGFVDDTRAYCSIPARHDVARRIDSGYLTRLAAEGRLDEDEVLDTAVDLAYRLAKATFRL